MNIVTIDPSLNCTAVVVNGLRFAFVNKDIAVTKKGSDKKWFDLAAPFISYNYIDYTSDINYSRNEYLKLCHYDAITSQIVNVIVPNIEFKPLKVYIEGYSFSSAAGKLIDLVTFGTLVRKKILDMSRTYDIPVVVDILAPTTLKLQAAKLTYPAIAKGKKVIKYDYKNYQGIAGGKFKKPEMLRVLTENPDIQNEWVSFLRTHEEELLSMKTIPKPIEDINDAEIMYHVAQKQ